MSRELATFTLPMLIRLPSVAYLVFYFGLILGVLAFKVFALPKLDAWFSCPLKCRLRFVLTLSLHPLATITPTVISNMELAPYGFEIGALSLL